LQLRPRAVRLRRPARLDAPRPGLAPVDARVPAPPAGQIMSVGAACKAANITGCRSTMRRAVNKMLRRWQDFV